MSIALIVNDNSLFWRENSLTYLQSEQEVDRKQQIILKTQIFTWSWSVTKKIASLCTPSKAILRDGNRASISIPLRKYFEKSFEL